MRVAILDDYQRVALASADWSAVRSRADIDVFTEHIERTEALVRVLEPYDVVVAMRERTFFDAPRLVLFPAAAVAGAVLGFNFLGDALRDHLDPRTRLELGL